MVGYPVSIIIQRDREGGREGEGEREIGSVLMVSYPVI